MICVIQRVNFAEVKSEGKTLGKCKNGLLVFLGVKQGDTDGLVPKMAEKILKMRIFEDPDGKMNLSVKDISGEILLVSNFTLCASCRKGTRPDFFGAEKPDRANKLYEDFKKYLEESTVHTESGEFGADMEIVTELSGPVTIILDSEKDLASE